MSLFPYRHRKRVLHCIHTETAAANLIETYLVIISDMSATGRKGLT